MRRLLNLFLVLFLVGCNPFETEGCGDDVPNPPSGFDNLDVGRFHAEVSGDNDLRSNNELRGEASPRPDTTAAFRLVVMEDGGARRRVAIQTAEFSDATRGDVLNVVGYYTQVTGTDSRRGISGPGRIRIVESTAERLEGVFAFCAERETVPLPGLPPLPDLATRVRGGFHVERPVQP